MADHVVDASIVLAMLKGEPGAGEAVGLMPGALVSAVNHAEIISKLIEWNRSGEAAAPVFQALSYEIADFTTELAFRAGLLRAETKSLGLSLGDRACIALALKTRLPVYTNDRRWKDLAIGADIRLLR